MPSGLYIWSQTAASNGNADGSINWAEGMSPAGVNDSGRAMMAAVAKYRDDISGAIVTGGTSTAYTVSSYQQFDSLAHLDGKEIAFTPHATNGATVTLSVDGLGNKPLRPSPGTELLPGLLVQGTPYVAVYNNADAVFYLRGFFGSPSSIPVGGSVDFWGASAPNSSLALMYGQAISRTAYSALFALLGTTYGPGDGSATFNIPDLRGRVVAGKDDMGGTAAARIGSIVTDSGTIVGATLGSVGGSPTHALTVPEMPSHNHTATSTDSGHAHTYQQPTAYNFVSGGGAAAIGSPSNTGSTGSASANITTTISNAGGGNAHAIIQPTIIANKLLRII